MTGISSQGVLIARTNEDDHGAKRFPGISILIDPYGELSFVSFRLTAARRPMRDLRFRTDDFNDGPSFPRE